MRHLALVLATAGTALTPLAAHAAGTGLSPTSQTSAGNTAVSSAVAPSAYQRVTRPAPRASLMTTTAGRYTNPRTQLGMRWSPVSSTAVKGYRFGYSTTDARETDRNWATRVTPLARSYRPFVFTTLVSGATYKVFVEVHYKGGKVARRTLTGTTQAAAAARPRTATPGALATPTVTNLAQTTMTANWQAPSVPGTSAIDGYQVGWGTWDSALLPGTARSMDLTGFVADTAYTIRVRAHNASGFGPWNQVTVRTPSASTAVPPQTATPGALATPTVTNLAQTTMTANWQAPSVPGTSAVDGYQVGWGTWDSALLPGTARSMDLTGFVAGTTYTIRVRAHNASGFGPWNQVTVRTPAAVAVPETSSNGLLGLPNRVTSVYWTNWNSHINITQVPTSYNTLTLFAAPRGGAEGSVVWNSASPTSAQIDVVRNRNQRVVLSTGGAGNGINFHSRYVSQNFVNSIKAINQKFGGTLTNPKIDGVDFNTFEAEAVPNTAEYLWIFGELKRQFGKNFIISAPPAPWKDQDKSMVRQALAQGLMDYAAPQYYDGPGLASPTYIINSVRDWVANVAGGDARKIAVGFGMENLPNYSTAAEIQTAWDTLERQYPTLRGAFVWQHRTDADRGWVYANQINPRVAN